MLSRSGAPVQAPGRMRCELHTSHQQLLFRLLFGTVCAERGTSSPLPSSALQKLPPELCVQKNLIWHAKSVCRSPDCLPNTLNLFAAISLLSGVVSLLKSVYTCVQVCRRTSSHIKQRWANRCAEEEQSEKNRSLEIGPAVWEEHT